MPNYWIWTFHGEEVSSIYSGEHDTHLPSSSTVDHTSEMNQIVYMQDMLSNALGQHDSFEEVDESYLEESSNDFTQRFYNLLAEANEPVFERVTESKLLVCISLLSFKSNWNIHNQALDNIAKLILNLTPPNNSLPNNYYEAKRLVSKLGVESKKIDCCMNDCMLFYDNDNGKNDASLLQCKFYGHPRYRTLHGGQRQKKPISLKSMFYLPIILKLQRMFASMQTTQHMTWHDEKKIQGMLRHPSDGQAWKHFDRKHPSFASDPRNV